MLTPMQIKTTFTLNQVENFATEKLLATKRSVQDRPRARRHQNGLASKFTQKASVRQEHSRSMSRFIAEPHFL
jgi:hypothetical protein